MNTEDYVSYEQAVKLKEKGFGWPCDMYYATQDYCEGDNPYSFNTVSVGDLITSPKMKEDVNDGWVVDEEYAISAPLLSQAQKWLREEKQCSVTVNSLPYNGVPYYYGFIIYDGAEYEILDEEGHWFDDYEEALSEGITKAVELI